MVLRRKSGGAALAGKPVAFAPIIPQIPTMAEAGFPEVEGTTWTALVVPAGTPKDIIAKLHDLIVASLANPDVKAKLAAMAYVPIGNSPQQCEAFFKAEMAKWWQGHQGRGTQGGVNIIPTAIILDLSCSAKAEHPVITASAVVAQSDTASCVFTGSSAGACHRAGHFGPDPLADADMDRSQCLTPLVIFRAAAVAPNMVAADFAEFTFGRAFGATRWVAVGTRVASRPPHRSVHAALPHTALTSGV